ncbi:hypothetical protein SteCoe_13316 [Stentor coeruleus]|uniref:Uncharacterized protein n=1 Tax=Stentor coeruleus TaxID=5963 RepID=A0A1R2C8R9_9CILI|nr:hypothetical protein SteCoe_13316 [Stentor coeruleus]
MKQESQIIATIKKKIDSLKSSRQDTKSKDPEGKSSSTPNLLENTGKLSKKYEHYSTEKLVKIIKCLKKENNNLKELNKKQGNEIKSLIEQLNKISGDKEESSSRPQSCLRTANSVPKKNRVMFSRDLVHVMNKSKAKGSKTSKSVKTKEESAVCYRNIKKIVKKGKNDSNSPVKSSEESEYYTPLSSSMQERKNNSQSLVKQYDYTLKTNEKQRLFTKVHKY